MRERAAGTTTPALKEHLYDVARQYRRLFGPLLIWVDPAEKLIALQMIQTPSEAGGPYRRAFRNLVYQALTN